MYTRPQTRLTDFSNCRTPEDLELTHLGALKTVLSEVLLLSREQRRFRQDLREALDRLGGRPADNSHQQPAASLNQSAEALGRRRDKAEKGDQRSPPTTAGDSESGALRAAVSALAREVAGLQAVLKGGRGGGSTSALPCHRAESPGQIGADCSPVATTMQAAAVAVPSVTAKSLEPPGRAAASRSDGPLPSGQAAAILASEKCHGEPSICPKPLTATGAVLERATSSAAAFASTSADIEFASVVLVGRQKQAGRRSAALPFSQEVAAAGNSDRQRDSGISGAGREYRPAPSAPLAQQMFPNPPKPPPRPPFLGAGGSLRRSSLGSIQENSCGTDVAAEANYEAMSVARKTAAANFEEGSTSAIAGPRPQQGLKAWTRRRQGSRGRGRCVSGGSTSAESAGVAASGTATAVSSVNATRFLGASSPTGLLGGRGWIAALAAAVEDDSAVGVASSGILAGRERPKFEWL